MSLSKSPARVAYLGLDACDPHVAMQLVQAGAMPNLAALLDRAAVAPTVPPQGVYPSAIWTSLLAATSVSRHGYTCWHEVDPATYELRATNPRDVPATPVWERVADAGGRSAVIDAPHGWVREGFPGALLFEWGSSDRHFGTASWPGALADELTATYGPHLVGSTPPRAGAAQYNPADHAHRADGAATRTRAEERALLDDLVESLRRKEALSLDLLDRGGWDLFLAVFSEPHDVGHQLWHVHDPEHRRHDRDQRAALGDPLVEVYRGVDRVIGTHLARLDADGVLYVHLSHGMQATADGSVVLDSVLHRIECALDGAAHHGWRTRAARGAMARVPGSARGIATAAVGRSLRRRIAAAPPAPPEVLPPRMSRRWYQIPNNRPVGAVRLNLAGRERDGVVAPADADATCAVLAHHLQELINVDTGRAAVVDVQRGDEVFRGADGPGLPDLLVEWDRAAPIERVWSPLVGTLQVGDSDWRSGDHRPDGLIAAVGPGIAARRLPTARVEDVGATLHRALGVDASHRADGTLIDGLLPSNVLSR